MYCIKPNYLVPKLSYKSLRIGFVANLIPIIISTYLRQAITAVKTKY
jgi:hypothetical protein